jgi:hypothetical protein
MKISIHDRAPFEVLNPSDAAAYLQTTGWKEVEHKPGNSSIWNRPWQEQTAELLLPLNRAYRDYVLRMSEVVQLIAALENRSQIEVLSDLQTAGTDIVRVRFRYAAAQDGSIPLARGEALVENTREMFLAGACAAVSRRPYFATLKPQPARDFVQNLRLGQSERGSYVLTVLSPVTPQLQPAPGMLFPEALEPPFERKAVMQTHHALLALRNAADEAMTSFKMDVFERAVGEGVSGNLCSALVGMGGDNPQPGDELAFSFTWARSRPADPSAVRDIAFPGDRFPVIAEAARLYRSSVPSEEIEVRGVIVQLKADQPQGPLTGPVIVRAEGDGKPRKIQITLDEHSHRVAIQAYESRAEVVCRGELTRSGTNLTLQNPRGFAILADD